jgi:uncharacterized protein
MDFKYKVADLPPEGLDITLALTPAEARPLLQAVGADPALLAGPVEGWLRLEPTGPRVVLRGSVKAWISMECARCLEKFDLSAEESIFVVYMQQPVEERADELEAESLNQEFSTGEEIDLWPMVYEHLLLSIPIKAVCREDCLGLCPVCGQNKNVNNCACQSKTGHPGLAALKEIRDKLPG